MKKIILEGNVGVIHFRDINLEVPIFVKHNGRLIGMVMSDYKGAFIQLSSTGHKSLNGYFNSKFACMKNAQENGYEFWVEVSPEEFNKNITMLK